MVPDAYKERDKMLTLAIAGILAAIIGVIAAWKLARFLLGVILLLIADFMDFLRDLPR